MRRISIDAEPTPFPMDPAKAAVIVVDMQNEFGSKGGMFDRIGIDVAPIQAAIAPTRRVCVAARAAGVKVVYLKMGFRPDLSDLGAEESVNRVSHLRSGVGETVRRPDGREGRILVRDGWGTEIVEGLEPKPGDVVLWKHRYSGFYQTELEAVLRNAGIDALLMTGCTTSVCVESTMRDAMFRDFRCLLLTDCTAEPLGSGEQRTNKDASTLLAERVFGWVATSAKVLDALEIAPA